MRFYVSSLFVCLCFLYERMNLNYRLCFVVVVGFVIISHESNSPEKIRFCIYVFLLLLFALVSIKSISKSCLGTSSEIKYVFVLLVTEYLHRYCFFSVSASFFYFFFFCSKWKYLYLLCVCYSNRSLRAYLCIKFLFAYNLSFSFRFVWRVLFQINVCICDAFVFLILNSIHRFCCCYWHQTFQRFLFHWRTKLISHNVT